MTRRNCVSAVRIYSVLRGTRIYHIGERGILEISPSKMQQQLEWKKKKKKKFRSSFHSSFRVCSMSAIMGPNVGAESVRHGIAFIADLLLSTSTAEHRTS